MTRPTLLALFSTLILLVPACDIGMSGGLGAGGGGSSGAWDMPDFKIYPPPADIAGEYTGGWKTDSPSREEGEKLVIVIAQDEGGISGTIDPGESTSGKRMLFWDSGATPFTGTYENGSIYIQTSFTAAGYWIELLAQVNNDPQLQWAQGTYRVRDRQGSTVDSGHWHFGR